MLAAVLVTVALLNWPDDGPRALRSDRPEQAPMEVSPEPERPAAPLTDAVGQDESLRALLPRIPENRRRDFHDQVLDILGRVPRHSILDVLIEEWLRAEKEGNYASFCRALREKIPRTDLLLLWYGYNLDATEGPPPFVRTHRRGADPYFNPTHFFEFHDFMGWYPAYHVELELPRLGVDELRRLHESWVVPLQRLPNPDELRLGIRLLRQLEKRYEHLRKTYGEYEFNTPEDRAVEDGTHEATRELFAAIKAEFPAEYDRLRKSDFWELETYQAGLLRADE